MTDSSVLISYDDGEPPSSLILDEEQITHLILSVLKARRHIGWEVSLFFASEERIKELNLQYRNTPSSTDVLSFLMGEEYTNKNGEVRYNAGDIVICLTKVCDNAIGFDVTANEELKRVIIHSILHLEGMDHATNDRDEPMLLLQEEILSHVSELEIAKERK